MYHKKHDNQLSVYDFVLPFGGHLNENNRWVVLRKMINWAFIEEEYTRNFEDSEKGPDGYSSDVAFGSLYIQRSLGFSDRELVEQIMENPYLQYFIGFKEYSNEKPFDPSLLVTFRKRFPEETMNRIIENMFIDKTDDNNDHGPGDSSGDPLQNDTHSEETEVPNKGTLIIDASCTPADIAYPTDLELSDKARRWTEIILDHYWASYGPINGKQKKPRTYRNVARIRFLKLNKRRRKSSKKIRAELRYQLNCICRNLKYIDAYVLMYGTDILFRVEKDRLETIRIFHKQQNEMLCSKTHRVADRIVSLSQPWVRPIVRGKSKTPTEFGAKISISVVGGYTFVDHISFDAYNEGESEEFERIVEKYKRRFGYYPERILADRIYQNHNNRMYCKAKGIHLSGRKLGRPGKTYAEDLRTELRESSERNAVEGKFGNGKRKLGLSLIMAKLKETTGTMITMDIFILNMERLFRQRGLLLFANFYNSTKSVQYWLLDVEWKLAYPAVW